MNFYYTFKLTIQFNIPQANFSNNLIKNIEILIEFA